MYGYIFFQSEKVTNRIYFKDSDYYPTTNTDKVKLDNQFSPSLPNIDIPPLQFPTKYPPHSPLHSLYEYLPSLCIMDIRI